MFFVVVVVILLTHAFKRARLATYEKPDISRVPLQTQSSETNQKKRGVEISINNNIYKREEQRRE